MLRYKMLQKSGYKWHVTKALCENLPTIDWKKTGKFGYIWLRVEISRNTTVEICGSEDESRLRFWNL